MQQRGRLGGALPPRVQGWRVFSLRRQNRALPVARCADQPHDWCVLSFVGPRAGASAPGRLSARQGLRAAWREVLELVPQPTTTCACNQPGRRMHCEVRAPHAPRRLRTIGRIQAPPAHHGPAGLLLLTLEFPFSGCLVAGNPTPLRFIVCAPWWPCAHATAHAPAG